ncbi:MAG: metallophosphoesterase [Eubacteriales bacterium]|nr:metallophosphoesterase [Eubacteriales bacterium]
MKMCLNILWILSILSSVCLGIVCLISFFENRKLVIHQYKIKNKKITGKFHGLKIVHLSDLHNASFGRENEKLIDRIKALQPDVIVATGDFVIGKPNQDVFHAAKTLNRLSEIATVYFSLGNHELRMKIYPDVYGDMWNQFYSALNQDIILLQDQTVWLQKENDKIAIHGLSLSPELYQRFRKMPMKEGYLEERFGKCSEDAFHIFMAHNPDYFDEYVKWGADLTFAGHIHGGMIRLPVLGGMISPMVRFFPKYDKGIFKQKNKYMILSGGLGNHTLKFRVNNLPEIVMVLLESASN